MEIQDKRSDPNREFDRREIESDVRLREIKAHEESACPPCISSSSRAPGASPGTAQSSAIRASATPSATSPSNVCKRLEGVAAADGEEVRQAAARGGPPGMPGRAPRRQRRMATLEKSEQELQTPVVPHPDRPPCSASRARPNTDSDYSLENLPSEETRAD